MLQEKALKARQDRARQEAFKITRTGAERAFSEYQVDSWSGRTYTVCIRSLLERTNSCTCPDFQTNNLGTCKHIEAVLLHLEETEGTPQVRRPQSYAEVRMDYGDDLAVILDLPPKPSAQIRAVAEEFFPDRALSQEGARNLGRLLGQLQAVPERVVIGSDVYEHLDLLSEARQDAEDEPRLLEQLERGQLTLPGMKLDLYPYQKRGAVFAALRRRTIIADDMGLGKTMQAIAAAMLLRERRGIRSVLVVCPASLKHQWQREIQRACDADALVIEGGQRNRKQLYGQDAFFKIGNYESVMRDEKYINDAGFDLVILDEAQKIKNWKTKTATAIKGLSSRYCIVLTGTPLENRLEELYSVVQVVDGRLLGPLWRFEEEHIRVDDRGRAVGYKGLDDIRKRLAPVMLRRRRQDVLKDLPDRIDQDYYVGMTPQQLSPYYEQQRVVAQLVNKKYMTEVDFQRLMCALQNMRMLCDSTYLFDQETNYSPKLEDFEELISEIALEGGRKVVVFTQWERMQQKVMEILDRLGIGYARLHGGVPSAKRGALIDRFREEPECKVFLSTDAGGVGLNLQAASTVINLDLPWNPAVLEQRIARVHRMGQTDTVHVINLIAQGAIEEHIRGVLHTKQALFTGLLEGDIDEFAFPQGGRRQEFVDTVTQMMEGEQEQEDQRAEEKDEGILGFIGQIDAAAEPAEERAGAEAEPEADPRTAEVKGAVSGFVEAGLKLLGAVAPGAIEEDAVGRIRQSVADAVSYDAEADKVNVAFSMPSQEQIAAAFTTLAGLFAPKSG